MQCCTQTGYPYNPKKLVSASVSSLYSTDSKFDEFNRIAPSEFAKAGEIAFYGIESYSSATIDCFIPPLKHFTEYFIGQEILF